MKSLHTLLLVLLPCVFFLSPAEFSQKTFTPPEHDPSTTVVRFSESSCTRSFSGLVTTNDVYDGGTRVGHSIWINRSEVGGKKVKAKYFAHKQAGQTVHERYEDWRSGKDVVLISSGAYSVGWDPSDDPVGITVDNGEIVTRSVDDKMDGLVIVEAVGGVRVSDIEAKDLTLVNANLRNVDVNDSRYKIPFLNWAKSDKATVFQSHLLIYKNDVKLKYNSSSSKARRKFLILATDRSGTLYHIIFYLKYDTYSLKDSTEGVKRYMNGKGMNIIASVNLDTGLFDVMSTGGDVKDCSGGYILGSQNNKRQNLTNMLAYYFD